MFALALVGLTYWLTFVLLVFNTAECNFYSLAVALFRDNQKMCSQLVLYNTTNGEISRLQIHLLSGRYKQPSAKGLQLFRYNSTSLAFCTIL